MFLPPAKKKPGYLCLPAVTILAAEHRYPGGEGDIPINALTAFQNGFNLVIGGFGQGAHGCFFKRSTCVTGFTFSGMSHSQFKMEACLFGSSGFFQFKAFECTDNCIIPPGKLVVGYGKR